MLYLSRANWFFPVLLALLHGHLLPGPARSGPPWAIWACQCLVHPHLLRVELLGELVIALGLSLGDGVVVVDLGLAALELQIGQGVRLRRVNAAQIALECVGHGKLGLPAVPELRP